MQAKYKIHDRWGQRQEGAGGPSTAVKAEPHSLEERAQRLEWNIRANKGDLPTATVKRERFEDDYVRENRNIGRGLEGGVDEELDYDMNDDFQDDEDSNTFYHNNEEDEEKKLLEEKQKKEYRWANYNVGDRPQIEGEDDDDDDDDLFGEKLTSEGKRLRKMMRRRAGGDDESLYDSTDDEVSSPREGPADISPTAATRTRRRRRKTRRRRRSGRQGQPRRAVRPLAQARARRTDGQARQVGGCSRLPSVAAVSQARARRYSPSALRRAVSPRAQGTAVLARLLLEARRLRWAAAPVPASTGAPARPPFLAARPQLQVDVRARRARWTLRAGRSRASAKPPRRPWARELEPVRRRARPRVRRRSARVPTTRPRPRRPAALRRRARRRATRRSGRAGRRRLISTARASRA